MIQDYICDPPVDWLIEQGLDLERMNLAPVAVSFEPSERNEGRGRELACFLPVQVKDHATLSFSSLTGNKSQGENQS